MFQGKWKCSKCSGEITELPFEPRSEGGLVCRTCYAKQKDGVSKPATENGGSSDQDSQDLPADTEQLESTGTEHGSESVPAKQSVEKKMFSGDWKCGSCDVAITELPFEPRETGNLKCIDCFKKSKGN